LENQKKVVRITPPGPLSRKVSNEEYNIIFPPPNPYTISLESASKLLIKDMDGNSYIDFTSGGLENSIGHSNKVIVKKIFEQSNRIISYDRHLSTDANAKELAVELFSSLKFKRNASKFFFGVTSEDCIETAFKLFKEKTGKSNILTTTHGCIGKRLSKYGLLGIAGKDEYLNLTNIFYFPAPYCFRCVFKLDKSNCNVECVNYIENFLFEQVIPRQEVAAMIIEPIMVKGGCVIPPEKYFHKLNLLTQKHNLSIIANEAEVGIGRTGSWLASDRFGLNFDLLIISNSLANGLPLSALIGNTEIFDSVDHRSYSRRYNTLSCSVAIEVIKYMKKNNLLENANKQGLYLKKRLNELAGKFDKIGEIRCIGLIAGIEIIKNDRGRDYYPMAVSKIVRGCLKSGLLTSICGKSTLLIAPALTVDSETLDDSIKVLKKVLSENIK
jgi:4-aminobutyrate aminotransferase